MRINPIKLVKALISLNDLLKGGEGKEDGFLILSLRSGGFVCPLAFIKFIRKNILSRTENPSHIPRLSEFVLSRIKRFEGLITKPDYITYEDFMKVVPLRGFGYYITASLHTNTSNKIEDVQIELSRARLPQEKEEMVRMCENYGILPNVDSQKGSSSIFTSKTMYLPMESLVDPIESMFSAISSEGGKLNISEVVHLFPTVFAFSNLVISFSYSFLHYIFSGKLEKNLTNIKTNTSPFYGVFNFYYYFSRFVKTVKEENNVSSFEEFVKYLENLANFIAL
uniref:Uncharacterized protein n=1 Tax=Fervidobacterium pennivorans TaxID=93466 RepID=A0A832IIL9_FERPE